MMNEEMYSRKKILTSMYILMGLIFITAGVMLFGYFIIIDSYYRFVSFIFGIGLFIVSLIIIDYYVLVKYYNFKISDKYGIQYILIENPLGAIIIGFRIVFSFIVFFDVLIGIVVIFIMDMIDYFFFNKEYRSAPSRHKLDKITDTICYSILYCYFLVYYFDTLVFLVFTIMFLYRVVGTMLFIFQQKIVYFMLFPNVFTKLAFVFVVVERFFSDYLFIFSDPVLLTYVVIVCFVFTLLQEFILHSGFSYIKYKTRPYTEKEIREMLYESKGVLERPYVRKKIIRVKSIGKKVKEERPEIFYFTKEEEQRYLFEFVSLLTYSMVQLIILVFFIDYSWILMTITPFLTFALTICLYKAISFYLFRKKRKQIESEMR